MFYLIDEEFTGGRSFVGFFFLFFFDFLAAIFLLSSACFAFSHLRRYNQYKELRNVRNVTRTKEKQPLHFQCLPYGTDAG